ncbi:Sortase family protein [Klenkia marina]|uniref:Sortase family protein n=1 Tax=Klenkia marina TaxID=1960309 RepID=A0A1G4YGD9_9ACTN|nr:class F sortase [Klenkia marina]SCX52580.1 Sortase family protein [Klenkia marina]
MAGHRHRAPHRGLTRLRWLLAAVAVVSGAVAVLAGSPPAPAVAGSPPAPVVQAATDEPVASVAPVSVAVPSVDLASSLVPIGVDGSGALVPPADYAQAGWFDAGVAPGQVGPAVLAGHVDSRSGPAVFYRLEEVAVGAQVLVGQADGSTLTFEVTRVAEYPKSAFATDEVYGPTVDAQLRLITCGGEFDRSRRSYVDNVVVYASLVQ